MSAITVVGGVYHERCIWPSWDQIYGSAGRAAAAMVGHVDNITLHGYARSDTAQVFRAYAESYGFTFEPTDAPQTISFEYIHSLSIPIIRPAPVHIKNNSAISVKSDVVLRFGMMEGTGVVEADRCVYDPQSTFGPEPFERNGSQAKHLAIVANRGELVAMGGDPDPISAARNLLSRDGAKVVVVKSGAAGAVVVHSAAVEPVPAFQTNNCWTLGSGDVFAAIFAARWGVHRDSPFEAACRASKAVAEYVESMSLLIPPIHELDALTRSEAKLVPGRIYIASPFFTLGQRWLVDETGQVRFLLDKRVWGAVTFAFTTGAVRSA